MEEFNRMLIDQINDRLKQSFDANLQAGEYCVVRARVQGVLSVLPAAAAGDDAVCGPASFADCIAYINGRFVNEPFLLRDPAPPHHATPPPGETP
ncbi:hypothetical protein [Luteibacter aegosomatissinici]|uniref:hypothetical protein n=1 Tax=Luteibacter aegosomatissinici TaxID=2911539 RepID=UPI001FFB5DFE|nr:hypothetical protein [Luteibacter aegosomatissinici]UPG95836.1 hypothetical protein L2Y97_06925 [Luteibacter aegosomatissinici]